VRHRLSDPPATAARMDLPPCLRRIANLKRNLIE